MSKQPALNLYILPLDVEIEECIATILEVSKHPFETYQASVQVKCGDAVSNIFHIEYKDGKELRRKLEVEVSKFKYVLFLYGKDELRRRKIII